jgi:TPR repeat protein
MDDCVALGSLYAEGDGVVKDAAKAKALFQKACDGGEPRACSAVQTPP